MNRRSFLRALPAAPLALLGTPAAARSGCEAELLNQTAPQPIVARGAEYLGSGCTSDGVVIFTQVTAPGPKQYPVGAIQTWLIRP